MKNKHQIQWLLRLTIQHAAPGSLSSKARIPSDFSTLFISIKQGEKRKRCHPKSDFRLWQATYFSTKNPINKVAMNNRRLLIAVEFHFVHPAKKGNLKTSQVHTDSVSFSCQSKQVSRCCINFPHLLTNQSIKIGRRAWPTCDLGEKSQKQLACRPCL